MKWVHQNWKLKVTKIIKHIECIFSKKKRNLNILRGFSCCEYAFSIVILLIFTHTPKIEKAGWLTTACHSNLILKNASSVPSCNIFITWLGLSFVCLLWLFKVTRSKIIYLMRLRFFFFSQLNIILKSKASYFQINILSVSCTNFTSTQTHCKANWNLRGNRDS